MPYSGLSITLEMGRFAAITTPDNGVQPFVIDVLNAHGGNARLSLKFPREYHVARDLPIAEQNRVIFHKLRLGKEPLTKTEIEQLYLITGGKR